MPQDTLALQPVDEVARHSPMAAGQFVAGAQGSVYMQGWSQWSGGTACQT